MGLLEDFRRAIQVGESDVIEFTEKLTDRRFAQTISAFANTKGGTIFVGVRQTPTKASPTDPIEVSVVGTDPGPVQRFVADLSRHFDDPLPVVRVEKVDFEGPNGPVVAALVSRHEGNDQVALNDLTIWQRRAAQNHSSEARARPIRSQTREINVEDKVTISDRADAVVERAQPGDSGKQDEPRLDRSEDPVERSNSAEGGSDAPPNKLTSADEAEVEERASVVVNSGDQAIGEDRGEEPNTERQNPNRFGSRAVFRREAGDTELALNADDYANVIATLLITADDQEKMNFAILGHWGRGKTYLIGRIKRQLSILSDRYSTVTFSAWKYRTTPEVWAYLFKQFLDEGKKTSIGLPFRASLVRTGAVPLLLALGALLLSLFSMSDKANLLVWMIRSFGISTILYVGFRVVRFQNTALRLKSLYSFTGHDDKLGLQAAIGDDLCALLKAWVPPDIANKEFLKNAIPRGLAYVALCLLISWKLWPIRDTNVSGMVQVPLIGPIPTGVNPCIALALYVTWIAVWFGGLICVCPWGWRSRGRVLLVIDDLDRCEPGQMLEIIESVLLILDDSEISCRLQVVMLIDESAFQHALLEKYEYLTKKHDVVSEHEYSKRRIVKENQEKYFLAHLRLPALSNVEIDEVTEKFARQLRGVVDDDGTEAKSTTTNPTTPIPDGESAQAQPVEQAKAEAPEFSHTSRIIEQHEMDAICEAIKCLASSEQREAIGPRAIRCLLFRYQLAREILIKLNWRPNAHELAKGVVAGHFGDNNMVAAGDPILQRVVRQVS